MSPSADRPPAAVSKTRRDGAGCGPLDAAGTGVAQHRTRSDPDEAKTTRPAQGPATPTEQSPKPVRSSRESRISVAGGSAAEGTAHPCRADCAWGNRGGVRPGCADGKGRRLQSGSVPGAWGDSPPDSLGGAGKGWSCAGGSPFTVPASSRSESLSVASEGSSGIRSGCARAARRGSDANTRSAGDPRQPQEKPGRGGSARAAKIVGQVGRTKAAAISPEYRRPVWPGRRGTHCKPVLTTEARPGS